MKVISKKSYMVMIFWNPKKKIESGSYKIWRDA